MSGHLIESIDELRERCDRLERIAFLFARAHLTREHGKGLHRAGPRALEAMEALGTCEDLELFDQLRERDGN